MSDGENMQFRVVGHMGDIQVQTEWMDIPRGEVEGVKIGAEMNGWTQVDIESDKEADD